MVICYTYTNPQGISVFIITEETTIIDCSLWEISQHPTTSIYLR